MRKQFTTTIEESTQNRFKEVCSENDTTMNDVLEALMESYINGELKVEKQTIYKVSKLS